MPHWNDVRLMLRSCSPASTKVRTSFNRKSGWTKLGMVAIEVEQRLLVLRQPEVVALFLQPFDLAAARRALAVDELRLGDEDLVDGAVPAFVLALVDVAACLQRGCQISCAARWWRGSVVRMKSSFEMCRSRAHLPERGSRPRRQTRVVSLPAFCAARSTFCPCSSVPVRKNTSSPSRRRDRAIASATIVV